MPRGKFPAVRELRIVPVLAVLIVAAAAAPRALASPAPFERVVVLGFDGADAHLVEQYMAEGKLPHLQALKESGTYAPLRSTNPPQTPVSWASFATGLNPGRTEIFDFLRRTEGTYLPEFAMIKEGKKTLLFGDRNPWALGALIGVAGCVLFALVGLLLLRRGLKLIVLSLVAGAILGGFAWLLAARWMPREVPDARNARKGLPFWTAAAAAGLPTRVIHVPDTFP